MPVEVLLEGFHHLVRVRLEPLAGTEFGLTIVSSVYQRWGFWAAS